MSKRYATPESAARSSPSILGSKVAYQAWVNLAFTGSQYYGGGGFPNDGNIYSVSDLNLNDAGTPIMRIRQAPYIADRQFNVFHHRLRAPMQTASAVQRA